MRSLDGRLHKAAEDGVNAAFEEDLSRFEHTVAEEESSVGYIITGEVQPLVEFLKIVLC